MAKGGDLPATAPGFAGRWFTTYGEMALAAQGAKVTGTYRYGGTEGRLEGAVRGATLAFEYREPGERGRGEFRLLREGRFAGGFTAEGEKRARRWDGERGWDGIWETTFGRLRLVEEEGRVHGYYEGAGSSTIEGRASGEGLAFAYREPRAEGEGRFTLSGDGRSFSGEWRTRDGGAWRPWTGTRLCAEPRVTWLYVLEAHWQRSLAENEYAFGHMLREVFARIPAVRVRSRFFQDAESLEHWTRELLYLPEPAILVIASHGLAEGLSVHGEVIDTSRVLESLRYAENLRLLHFSACLVGLDGERALAGQPFPVSGYATSVDWGASALLEFTFLDLILNRGMHPDEAAAKLPLLVPYAADRAPRGSPYPAAGFRYFPAAS